MALAAKLAGRLSLVAQPAGGSRALGAAFRATVRTKRWRPGVEEDAAGRLGMVVPRFEGRRFRIRTPSCFGLRVVSWLWSLWILVAAGALKLCSSSVFFRRPGRVRSPSVCAARLNLLGKDVGRDSCRSRPPAPSPRLWYSSLRWRLVLRTGLHRTRPSSSLDCAGDRRETAGPGLVLAGL